MSVCKIFFLLVLFVIMPASAELYKCTDPDGSIEYKDRPCRGKALQNRLSDEPSSDEQNPVVAADPSCASNNQPLAGFINGKPWEFQRTYDWRNGDGYFFSSNPDATGYRDAESDGVIVGWQLEPAAGSLGPSKNVTLYIHLDENIMAGEGSYEVNDGGDVWRVFLCAKRDEGNWVRGRVDVPKS